MLSLQSKLNELESKIKYLSGLITLLANVKAAEKVEDGPRTYFKPEDYTQKTILATDVKSGLSDINGGKVIFNTAELTYLRKPPLCTEKDTAFNSHFHSGFSGGALEANQTEIVEYERADSPKSYIKGVNGADLHPDCQSYWSEPGKIKIAEKNIDYTDNTEKVEKIGPLALIFDPQAKNWGTSALELNVGRCVLTMKKNDGTLAKDSNDNEMLATLYSNNSGKTNVIWDKNSKCWRFYAVYYGAVTSVAPTIAIPETPVPATPDPNAIAYPAGSPIGAVQTTPDLAPAPSPSPTPSETPTPTPSGTTVYPPVEEPGTSSGTGPGTTQGGGTTPIPTPSLPTPNIPVIIPAPIITLPF